MFAVGVAILPAFIDNVPVLITGIFIWGGVTAGMYTVGLAHLGARLSGADLAQAPVERDPAQSRRTVTAAGGCPEVSPIAWLERIS